MCESILLLYIAVFKPQLGYRVCFWTLRSLKNVGKQKDGSSEENRKHGSEKSWGCLV